MPCWLSATGRWANRSKPYRCRQGRQLYPDDVELLFQEGVVLRLPGHRAAARERWLSLLQSRSAEHFASIDSGLVGYKALHNLAVLELAARPDGPLRNGCLVATIASRFLLAEKEPP